MIKFCNLFSGSSGNCTFVSSQSTKILIDAGVSCQKISKALSQIGYTFDDIDAIFITHEHIDHTKGLHSISKKYQMPIYASIKTWSRMEGLDISYSSKASFLPNKEIEFGDLTIYPFSIPHDAIEPCGFNIYAENKKITIATDIGHMENNILKCMENSDVLLLESNYDLETLKCGPYPFFLKERIAGDFGHLSNDTASKVISHLCKNGVTRFVLGHLSKENNFPELAYQTVINELVSSSLCVNDFQISVAKRDSVDEILELA